MNEFADEDAEIVRRVEELLEAGEWRHDRIGLALGMSSDRVGRIVRQIFRGQTKEWKAQQWHAYLDQQEIYLLKRLGIASDEQAEILTQDDNLRFRYKRIKLPHHDKYEPGIPLDIVNRVRKKLGAPPFIPAPPSDKRLAAAKSLLERAGYTVTPPVNTNDKD